MRQRNKSGRAGMDRARDGRSRQPGTPTWAPLAVGAAFAVVPLLALIVVLAGSLLNPKADARDEHGASTHGVGTAGATAGRTAPPAPVFTTSDRLVRGGVAVAFSIGPADGNPDHTAVVEGEFANLRFTLSDATTGAPMVPTQRPAVWLDRQREGRRDGGETSTCEDKVRLYSQGRLGYRPDVDLNSYFVLSLNQDASISVIDPLLGVTGMTQLYKMATLKRPGEDWVVLGEEGRLFVTMPQAGQVAVVDTESFAVLKNVDAGSNPVRIALQPDSRYLWVGNDASDARQSGVTVIDPREMKVVAQIPTGLGHHELAFSAEEDSAHAHDRDAHRAGDTGYAFVTNRDAGTLTVIDIASLKKVKDITVGKLPTALEFSGVSNAVYVASEADGTISVVDANSHRLSAQIGTKPGLAAFRFAPGGRWGFAVNARSNLVDVIDASTNRIAHSSPVGKEPDKITFTDGYAYIRSRGVAEISVVDLAGLGKAESLPLVRVIAGQTAPGESPFRSVAGAISPVHEHGNHVLIANPADQYIYYYMEGMNAPAGGFQTYGRTPRAVRVVDRSLRETAPGTYDAKVSIPKSGRYEVVFLLDSPRIIHCFEFAAQPNLAAANRNEATPLEIEFLTAEREARAGEPFALQFRLVDARSGEAVSGLGDVQFVASLASGQWSERYRALAMDNGVYEATVTVPGPGVYTVVFSVPSLKVAFDQLPSLVLLGVAGKDPS